MESQKFRNILKRFLAGNASRPERSLVNKWYDSFDDGQQHDHNHDAAKEEVWGRIGTIVKEPGSVFSISWRRIAAAVLLLMTTGALSWLIIRNTVKKEETYSSYQTRPREHKDITLRDGSHLILNSSTHVRIADDFSKTRRVELVDGEIFFNITRDPQRPFIVQSGLLQTKVLGTSFSIRKYRELDDISVSVLSGKVSIANGNTMLNVLTKGQHFIFNKTDSTYQVTQAPAKTLAWIDGKVVLEDASFLEMATIINRHYGIVITAADAQVNKTRYTATLRADMQPLQAMEVLAAIHGFNVQSKQDTIMLIK